MDVGAFLADPTFARLAVLCTRRARARPADSVLLGPDDFSHVMLLVPGAGGQVASLYVLADELRRRLPARTAVAIVDLDAVLCQAPADAPLWHVSRRLVQIVRDLGVERVTGLVGYSLGALLLLQLAGELRLGRSTPLWLLDAFSPRFARAGFWRRVERRLAWTLFGGAPGPGDAAFADPKRALPAPRAGATEAQWQRLGEQLRECRFDAPNARVHLIQARQNVVRIGLLWRRRHNRD